MLFIRTYKIPTISFPSICGTRLALSPEVKYLGLILDSKFNWGANLVARIRKAACAAYCCSRALESREVFAQGLWGIYILRTSNPNSFMALFCIELLWTNNAMSDFLKMACGHWSKGLVCDTQLASYCVYSISNQLRLLQSYLVGTLYSLVNPLF